MTRLGYGAADGGVDSGGKVCKTLVERMEVEKGPRPTVVLALPGALWWRSFPVAAAKLLQNGTAAAVSRCRRSVNSMKATVYMMVAINDLWPFVSL